MKWRSGEETHEAKGEESKRGGREWKEGEVRVVERGRFMYV